jgi:hypothetical protein
VFFFLPIIDALCYKRFMSESKQCVCGSRRFVEVDGRINEGDGTVTVDGDEVSLEDSDDEPTVPKNPYIYPCYSGEYYEVHFTFCVDCHTVQK